MHTDRMTGAVLRVGDGRGFVVKREGYRGQEERVVITAAHCLAYALLANGTQGLPPCHPWRYLGEETYKELLGPLSVEPTVWATCLFVDQVADIALLGEPDNQALPDEWKAYNELVDSMEPLPVVDAPAQGTELLTFGEHQFENPTPGEGPGWVLSLDGHWREGRVQRRINWLQFNPKDLFVGGMSGSPILDMTGAAMGVVSVDSRSPVIVDSLAAHLVRSITALQREKAVATDAEPTER
jgi:hypothetical protein